MIFGDVIREKVIKEFWVGKGKVKFGWVVK